MAESKEKLKSPLKRVKEESEKAGLKFNIQKMLECMESGSITSWQTDREKMGTVTGFIFLDSRITGDGDCNNEIRRCLFLEEKL